MRSIIQFFLGLLVLIGFFGCSHIDGRSSRILIADLDKAKVITMNPKDIIWLETNDSSLIYDISGLFWMKDRMVIQSRSSLKSFYHDGRFYGDVAKKGDAPEDFTWIGNTWKDDSLVYLFDGQIRKIQKYDDRGNYHGYDTITFGPREDYNTQPCEAYFTKDDGVFYVNTFFGCPPFSYIFCHADSPTVAPKAIESKCRENGHTFWNRVFIDNDNHRLLYWEHVKDTLFTVDQEGVYPTYIFDYGKNKVPQEIAGKPYVTDRLMDLHELGENDYAYPMRYFQMHKGKIYFVVPKNKQGYIGCIDEKKKEVAFTEFRSPEELDLLPQIFFLIEGDDILLSVIDEGQPESNPGLLRIPISEIKKP